MAYERQAGSMAYERQAGSMAYERQAGSMAYGVAYGGHVSRLFSRNDRRGMVLIVVLVVVVMISLAGFSFVASMHIEDKAARLRGEQLQLENAVGSGEALLKAVLEQPLESRQAAGGIFDNPELFRGAVVHEDEAGTHSARVSIVSPRVENDQVTGWRFGVENESARLNLAALLQWDRQRPGAARQALMHLPGMTESIADAILDWIDEDQTPREFGAESDYYAGLDPPYAPRNGIPESLEELLLVRGVTRELLFGFPGPHAPPDRSESPQNSARSFAAGSRSQNENLPWASLLTLYSGERNESPERTPRIYLNDPDLATLHARLSERFDQSWADFLIAYRQFGPYSGSEPANAEATGMIDFAEPASFSISSVLDLVGARVELPSSSSSSSGSSSSSSSSGNGSSQILGSPFPEDPQSMAQYLPQLLDYTTVVSHPVIRGRVNVNLAPRSVLLGVPELSEGTVERIISQRNLQTSGGDSARRHATWLLTEGVVDLPQMRTLMPYLTGGGDVVRTQIVGFFDDSGPQAPVEVVLDATETPPRRVYWKSLQAFGSSIPREVLGAEPDSRPGRTNTW